MFDFLRSLVDTSSWPPRWYCGSWTAGHGWTHVVSDSFIFGAYTAIPIVLAYFVIRRKEVFFPRIFWLFCAFIFACGTTHLFEAMIFWWPAYRLLGAAKVVTAVVSWLTVLAMIPVLPSALALTDVEKINTRLEDEIKKQRQSEFDLRLSHDRLKAVLETAVEGIITIDLKGTIESFNPAAEAIFGYRTDEVIGRNVSMLMPPPDSHEHDQYLRNYLQTGQPRIIGIGREVVGRRKNGERFPMELSVSESRSDHWRFFTGIVRDITEQREAQETIHRHREDMENFLSIVAHDLRNPTASVITLLSLFKEDCGSRLDADGGRMIDDAIAECERTFGIIDQLNAVARIGRAKITLERIRLGDLIRRTVSRYRQQIRDRRVEVQVECDHSEVVIAMLQVEEALINLMDNALKYGCSHPHPRIDIRAGVENGNAFIEVKDNGSGIPSRLHEHAFKIFQRLDPEGSAPGTGVGLTAVQHLMRHIGGSVTLTSEEGEGAVFTLEFPNHAPSEVDASSMHEA